MSATARASLEQLLELGDERIAAAFLEAVGDLNDRVVLARVVEALERGNVEAALDAMLLEPGSFETVVEAMRESFMAAGRREAAAISALRSVANVAIIFSGRNVRAENWLRERSASMITGLVNEQRQSVRRLLVNGLASGQNPRRTALDIVGRINPQTRRRSGGVIGLANNQLGWVQNARAELESQDPADWARFLKRSKRDKRSDRSIAKAVREGKRLTQAQINSIIGRYADNLLRLRGENIGRTESLQAFNASRYEAWTQAVDAQAVPASAVRVRWSATLDMRLRNSHRQLHGQTRSLGQVFVSPLGSQMLHPGDTTNGAAAADIINCRCRLEFVVDRLAISRWRRQRGLGA